MSWCCVLLCLLPACWTIRPHPKAELVQRSQPLLGTFVTISAYGPNRAATLHAITAAFEEFKRADAVMSLHRPDSELARVNASAATNGVVVSTELFIVLQLAQDIATQTDGAFDITIRPLADLWGFIWKQHRLPTPEELERTLPLVNFQNIQLDPATRIVRFRERTDVTGSTENSHNELLNRSSRREEAHSILDEASQSLLTSAAPKPMGKGISIDLGGIGKGVAVDWAMAKLQSLGVTNAMVKAGGDLRVSGAPPGETHWIAQLEDPGKEGQRVSIPLREAALSTSGNYENFFEVAGRRYSHILDPRTGRPVEGIAACTVIAPTCAESDAWATALFVYGVERSRARFGQRFAIRFTTITNDAFAVKQTDSFPRPLGQ